MRVSQAMFLTLSRVAGITVVTGSMASCSWFGGPCDTTYSFDVDEEITAADVDYLLGGGDVSGDGDGDGEPLESIDDITCADLCRYYGGEAANRGGIDSCDFDLDGYVPPPDDPGDTDGTTEDDVVGMIQCSGSFTEDCPGGRRPQGHLAAGPIRGDALGRSFARAAHLEAASVVAFAQLARQLEGWGAPSELIERCKVAADEEVVHARMMGAFAQAHGVEVPPVEQRAAQEGLRSAAMHNATEGCVSETWAALLGHVQAVRAEDPKVREAFAIIAEDETRHAQLAWDLHAWFMSHLNAEDRVSVLAAQRQAIAELAEFAEAQAQSLPGALGVPSADVAVRMAEDFGEQLLAA